MTHNNRLHFSMRNLALIKPDLDRRVDYYDSSIRGLCFAVYKSGTKTWFVYQSVDGKPERIKIGRFPAVDLATAKNQLKKIQGQIAMGFNPNQTRRDLRAEPTLKQFFDESFLERYAKIQKKSWKADVSLFKNHLSRLGNKRLSVITDAQVSRLHRRIGANNGPVVANRVVTLLKTLFNMAIKWREFSGTNPVSTIEMYPESSREVFLTTDEVKTLMASVVKEDDEGFHVFVKLCWMSGMRSGNLITLKWSQVSEDFERLEIPRENMKNKKSHIAPLTEQASALLKTWKSMCSPDSEFVFHDGDSKKCGRRFRYLFSKASRNSGVECSPHSLRHFVGSHLVSSGISLAITQQVLGHVSYKSTLVYSKVAPSSVRESLRLITSDMFEASEEPKPVH